MDKEIVDRKKSWWLVAITSVIALASIVSQIRYSKVRFELIEFFMAVACLLWTIWLHWSRCSFFSNQLSYTAYLKYIFSTAVITTAVGVIFALALTFQVNLLLKVELLFAWTNLILWIIALRFLFNHTDLATRADDNYTVTISNANIYYFRYENQKYLRFQRD